MILRKNNRKHNFWKTFKVFLTTENVHNFFRIRVRILSAFCNIWITCRRPAYKANKYYSQLYKNIIWWKQSRVWCKLTRHTLCLSTMSRIALTYKEVRYLRTGCEGGLKAEDKTVPKKVNCTYCHAIGWSSRTQGTDWPVLFMPI